MEVSNPFVLPRPSRQYPQWSPAWGCNSWHSRATAPVTFAAVMQPLQVTVLYWQSKNKRVRKSIKPKQESKQLKLGGDEENTRGKIAGYIEKTLRGSKENAKIPWVVFNWKLWVHCLFSVCGSRVFSRSVCLICMGIWGRQIELSVLGPSSHPLV